MKRILSIVVLLVLAQGALAEEPRLIKKAGEGIEKGEDATVRGIKKGGQAAGRGIEKGAQYPIKGIKKAEGWIKKKLGKDGEQTEKADK